MFCQTKVDATDTTKNESFLETLEQLLHSAVNSKNMARCVCASMWEGKGGGGGKWQKN